MEDTKSTKEEPQITQTKQKKTSRELNPIPSALVASSAV